MFGTIVVDGEIFPYIPLLVNVTQGQGHQSCTELKKMLPLFFSCLLIHIPIIRVNAMVTREVDLPYKVQKVTPLKVKVTEVDRKCMSRLSFCGVMN